jgi:peptidoglycan/LPS O-acetylase OafA/YrhL
VRAAVAVFVLSGIAFVAFRHTVLACLLPVYCALFTFGMLACEISYGRLAMMRDRVPWLALLMPVLIIFIALIYRWQVGNTNDRTFVLDCLTGLLSAGLLILSSRPGTLHSALSTPWLAWLGTFAYSIYLIHAPLVQICWQYGVAPLHLSLIGGYMAIVLVGLPLIVTLCYGFFLVCESPFLNKMMPSTMPK